MANCKTSESSSPPAVDPGTGLPSSSRTQFSIPDLLQLYRQTLYMAVKEAEMSAAGNPFGEEGLAKIRTDLDNWNNVEFDPPGCLRLSKKSGACQKIVSYWKKLLGSILTDRDPSSFGNHDRGVMTICKLLHKDFQVAASAVLKWNERDYPNIPTDQVKEKLSMNQLTFLCRRYHNDLTLIAHAFKSSVGTNDFKFLNPRLTETYPIDVSEEGKDDVNNVVAAASPTKPEKRKRPKAEHGNGESTPVSMADLYGNIERMPQMGKFPDFGNSSPLASPLYPGSPMFHSSFDPKKSDAHQKTGGAREYAEQHLPIDLGRQSLKSGRNAHENGTISLARPFHPGPDMRDEQRTDLVRLRDKNRKYVAMIMGLVQQLVAAGQIPFVDLRSIDPEDRDDSQIPAADRSPSIQPSLQVHQQSVVFPPTNGTSKREGQSGNASANPSAKRSRQPKPMPKVTFDRTTMSWDGNVHSHPQLNQSYGTPRANEPSVPASHLPSRATYLPLNPSRSALSTLLEKPPLNTGAAVNANKASFLTADTNGHGSGKSKRKSNPIKRELPGFAPRVAASPDVSGASDETGSVGSADHAKNVKASLYVPPVEDTYVERRGGMGQKKLMDFSDMHDSCTGGYGSGENDGGTKRKSGLQSMADSIMYANSGLAAMSMPSPLAEMTENRVARIPTGTAVFGRLEDGNLYPGEVVEKVDNCYVIAWMHANFSSTVHWNDVFGIDEVLIPPKQVLTRMVDDYQPCVLIECHRGRLYTVISPKGVHRRCALADIVVRSNDHGLYSEPLDEIGLMSPQRGSMSGSFEGSEPNLICQSILRNAVAKTMNQFERNPVFRNTCFTLTFQKTSLYKGYDDEQIVALIQAAGGTVAKKFEDFVSCSEEKYLVAPCTCTTAKFFQCLAANIPCLSFQWVLDCCSAQAKLDIAPYILPAGMDNENVILWIPRNSMFGDERIGLYDAASKLCEVWFLALKAGNVSVHVVDPDSATKDLESVDILIVESTCPEMLQETARAAGVHVVNETWLKKSLIHGKMQDRNNPDFLPISE